MSLNPIDPITIATLTDISQTTSREDGLIADKLGAVTRPWRLWRAKLDEAIVEIQAGFVTLVTTVNQIILQALSPWVDVAYNAANFTTNSTGSWTVDAGDQQIYRYCLIGNSMLLAFCAGPTTIGNATTTELRVALPAGFRATQNAARQGGVVWSATGVAGLGAAFILGGGQYISLQRVDAGGLAAGYPAVVNDLYIGFTISFEVNKL